MANFHIPPPPHFMVSSDVNTISERWKEWIEEFSYYMDATGVSSTDQKRGLLLYTAGPEVREIFKTMNMKDETYENIVSALDEKFASKEVVRLLKSRTDNSLLNNLLSSAGRRIEEADEAGANEIKDSPLPQADIFIYTSCISSWGSFSSRSCPKSPFSSFSPSSCSCGNIEATEVPVDKISTTKHWKLVAKYEHPNPSMYIDAYNEGDKLKTNISYNEEPECILTKTYLGKISCSPNDIHECVHNHPLKGEWYNLIGVNCQSFIKYTLKIICKGGHNLKTIGDTCTGYFWESSRLSTESSSKLLGYPVKCSKKFLNSVKNLIDS